ncbi:hypothetical protein [Burkholderia diffusa]|uniref:hypothetical protein n=1 Tax=Burkholderia diffusa TaxID=488732 RepID=UPI0015892222|nr:hypothetical protein [Burkholderia diffusa]
MKKIGQITLCLFIFLAAALAPAVLTHLTSNAPGSPFASVVVVVQFVITVFTIVGLPFLLFRRLRPQVPPRTKGLAMGSWFQEHAERITGFMLLTAFITLWLLSMWAGDAYCAGTQGLALFICHHVWGSSIALFAALVFIAWIAAWIFGRTDSLIAAAAFVLSSLMAVVVYLWMTPLDVVEWFLNRLQRRR